MATRRKGGRKADLAIQVAACTRLLHLEGILDYSGHVSARLEAAEGFLIQPFEDSRAALSPERLLTMGLDGSVREGPAGAKPPKEVHLHTEIFRRREDAAAIIHFHPEHATLFTLAEGVPLLPMKMHAARWAGGIPVYGKPGHIATAEQARDLVAAFGPHHAALLRAHGAVLVAESLPGLLVDAIHFEENAKAQFQASALGKLAPLSKEELEHLAGQSNRGQHVPKLWKYYVERGVHAGVIPRDWLEAL